MADEQASQAAWDAMNALPRPVTENAALAAAEAVLAPIGLNNHFAEWWKSNGAHVLRRLNG